MCTLLIGRYKAKCNNHGEYNVCCHLIKANCNEYGLPHGQEHARLRREESIPPFSPESLVP